MSSDLAANDRPQRRWLVRWFPVGWLLNMLALWGVVQVWGNYGLPRDKQVFLTIVLANLAWIGALAWLLFAWQPIMRLKPFQRWAIRLGALLAIVAGFSSIDVDYDGDSQWKAVRFRWSADPDEKLESLSEANVASDWEPTPDDYPRFLGTGYWAEVTNVQLEADWEAHPPELVWKRPIGAGWSAFAVVGDFAVTQEQRGEEELVTCYRVSTGDVVWTHADAARYDPATMVGGLGGVGPRATPTIDGERIYTMGATGIINCLDARTGKAIWSHDLPEEFDIAPLLWANAGSPLVVPDTNLVVFNGGKAKDATGHSLLAFDRDTGKLVWQTGPQITSYASPVYAVLGGVPQIVQVNEDHVGGYRASDGKELWKADQPGRSDANASCSQPIPLSGDRILVSKGYGIGSRLIQLSRNGNGAFAAKIVWERNVLRTKLANLVLRDGYAYGLDEILIGCATVDEGKRQWKKRRRDPIGHGQLLLVGDVILALTEEGEGVLIECNPERYVELAAMQMLTSDGVTWNNPALAGRFLLVRNNLEAACYQLPLAGESARAVAMSLPAAVGPRSPSERRLYHLPNEAIPSRLERTRARAKEWGNTRGVGPARPAAHFSDI